MIHKHSNPLGKSIMENLEISSQITFLKTGNLEETHHFYQNILGFPLALDQGSCRIYRVLKNGFIGFCLKPDFANDDLDIILTIVTPNVDAWYTKLSHDGVDFIKIPQLNRKYKIYHCFFRDPNGYLIEIQSFLDPRWK